ncbi:phage tail tube protein [Hyphomonas pacifica]|uniref:Uncharacterized protein n=1 Tax=Hyphomonas pacifica TaxID=1280941 RepID=A0A8B2PLI2_9PROT|nr:phage tail tube protein [Hyphomonas pacifica]RAN30633.1 hypothetical protein HY3_05645 [Hyphomonas pacifica]
MSTLRGKTLVMTGAMQDDFETPAASPAYQLAYYDEAFNSGEGLESDPEIRADVHNARDATDPAPALASPSGNVTVAADMNSMLFWMTLLYGAPATTGAEDPYSHVFASGKEELPSATLEVPMGEDRWKAVIGAKANSLSFNFDKEAGYKKMSLGMVAREVRDITGAGNSLFEGENPTIWTRAKAAATLATFAIDGVTVGRCVGGGFQYTNNLNAENFADGSEFPSDYFAGDPTCETTPRLRMAKTAAANAALNKFQGVKGAPFAASISLPISASRSLVINMPRCWGEKISPAVGGTGPVEFQGRIVAVQGPAAPAMTATLINEVAAL